jgi:metallo-beta-lactamase family protein
MSDTQFIVDCGMHQGEGADELNRAPFPFDPRGLSFALLTHAHIDHSGLTPKLVKEGFTGRIMTTAATADLLEIMLQDSAQLQEKDAEWLTRKSFRAGADITYTPLYTQDDVKALLPLIERKPYSRYEHLLKNLSYRFVDAGHILGSGTLVLSFQDGPSPRKIVFSGDIGRKGNPIIRDPESVEEADYVVVESTYGNRLHKGLKESIDELVEAIRVTFKRGGNVLIPAFAVGRTQDLLYVLNRAVREGRLRELEVYVDSPLAGEATKVYLAHPEVFDEEALEMFRQEKSDGLRLHFTESVEESQKINRRRSGAVIIAGSGMCEGGRIRHHLKHNLWRPECCVVFVGFQAKGTLGRRIVDGARMVHVLGEDIAVRAKVSTIGGFSAHADQRELIEWLRAFTNHPRVFIVHGEEESALAFEETVKSELGFSTTIPRLGESFEI